MEYYDTYSFVAFIHSLAINGYAVPEWHDGFDDFIQQHSNDLLVPFRKISTLHLFIIFIVYNSFVDEVDDVVFDSVVNKENYTLWVSDTLQHYGIPHTSFGDFLKLMSLTLNELENESTIIQYYHFLYEIGALRKLLYQIAEEVFFVLFSNRGFLYQFNKQISSRSSKLEMTTLP